MPFVPTARATTAQFLGIGLPKLQTALSNRFIGHDNPSLCQKLFNIAKTERKAEIQPDSVTDNFRWEAVAFVIGSSSCVFMPPVCHTCSTICWERAKLTIPNRKYRLCCIQVGKDRGNSDKQCSNEQPTAFHLLLSCSYRARGRMDETFHIATFRTPNHAFLVTAAS